MECKSPKDIQKVTPVDDCINTVIEKPKSVVKFGRENLLGHGASTIHKI